jgi:SAM-dependent methyltransferase
MTYDSFEDLGLLYDYVGAYNARADIAFYLDEATRTDGKILEIASGTGRVLLPIARAGKEITGVELSRKMLGRCRERVAAEPDDVRARITLVEGDMRDFSVDGRFTLATIPFRPMQHLMTIEDQLSCLDAIRRHLEPGGRLIFDVYNPDLARIGSPAAAEWNDTPETALPNGSSFHRGGRMVSVHRIEQVNEVELIYYVTTPDGKTDRRVHAFSMRWYLRAELEHLLARAGFVIDAIYGNFDRSPLTDDAPEMVVVSSMARHSR